MELHREFKNKLCFQPLILRPSSNYDNEKLHTFPGIFWEPDWWTLNMKYKPHTRIKMHWISNIVNFQLELNPIFIILGYYIMDSNFIPVNMILMVTKSYIFNCAHQQRTLNFRILQHKIKQCFFEQEMLANLNQVIDNFNKIWYKWRPLFHE